MKKLVNSAVAALLILWILPGTAAAAELLVPVGKVVGLELGEGTAVVAAFDDSLGSAARESGLQIGDEILRIDGKAVSSPEEIRDALRCSDGKVELQVERGGKEKSLTVYPQITADGPKLGIYLRRGVTGIGTVTWYDPESGDFGTLGHGVNNAQGELLRMVQGNVYPASVASVKKGKAGNPGQLRGQIENTEPMGSLYANTGRGVFGEVDEGWRGEALPVAAFEDIRVGQATIRSNVSGQEIRDYSVEILKIYPENRSDGRNLLLRVTDPALIDITGGIVQGMGVSYNKDNQVNP